MVPPHLSGLVTTRIAEIPGTTGDAGTTGAVGIAGGVGIARADRGRGGGEEPEYSLELITQAVAPDTITSSTIITSTILAAARVFNLAAAWAFVLATVLSAVLAADA